MCMDQTLIVASGDKLGHYVYPSVCLEPGKQRRTPMKIWPNLVELASYLRADLTHVTVPGAHPPRHNQGPINANTVASAPEI